MRKISVSGSFWTTVSGSLGHPVEHISVSGSLCADPWGHLYQDPVGAHDLCNRLFWTTVSGPHRRTCARSQYQEPFGPLASKSSKTTCAKSLYQDPSGPLCWDPSGPMYQDPVGQVAQDLCVRISVWGSSCRSTCTRSPDLCVRLLVDHLYQDPVVALVQDLCLRISVGGSFWTTCIRIL